MTKKYTLVQSIVFHLLRSVLIVALLTAGLFAILYCSYLMNLATGQLMGVQSITAQEYYGDNYEALASVIPQVANDLAHAVLKAVIVAAVVMVLLLLLPRVRRYHKSLLITAALISAFCLLVVALGSPVLTDYARNLKGSNNLFPGD